MKKYEKYIIRIMKLNGEEEVVREKKSYNDILKDWKEIKEIYGNNSKIHNIQLVCVTSKEEEVIRYEKEINPMKEDNSSFSKLEEGINEMLARVELDKNIRKYVYKQKSVTDHKFLLLESQMKAGELTENQVNEKLKILAKEAMIGIKDERLYKDFNKAYAFLATRYDIAKLQSDLAKANHLAKGGGKIEITESFLKSSMIEKVHYMDIRDMYDKSSKLRSIYDNVLDIGDDTLVAFNNVDSRKYTKRLNKSSQKDINIHNDSKNSEIKSNELQLNNKKDIIPKIDSLAERGINKQLLTTEIFYSKNMTLPQEKGTSVRIHLGKKKRAKNMNFIIRKYSSYYKRVIRNISYVEFQDRK